jgi:hypothetical protein
MDLAVVTCVGGNYARYLDDWARSILAQTVKPAQVAIVDNACDDPDEVCRVAEMVGARLVRLDRFVNYGRARNIAVSLTDCEWVQHFDCDDTMLPWALEETAQVLKDNPDADVIQWGWKKTVDGKTETRNYRALDGLQVLKTQAKGAGPSPFRRAMWERAPYDDSLEAAWDTGLWIGFGYLGATFRPTKRLCFDYRQHADSVFNSRTQQPDKFPLRDRVSNRLGELGRNPLDRAVVVMPWRDSGDPHRRQTMEWTTARWRSYGLKVVQAPDNDGNVRWNASQARNNATKLANARALIIADSDVMVRRETIEKAVKLCFVEPWVVTHGNVHRMSKRATDALMEHDGELPDPGETIRQPYTGVEGGGLLVITPGQFAKVGGYDEEFLGWGSEDEAFGMAARTLIGKPARLPSPLWHLYHPPGLRQKSEGYPDNRLRLRMYEHALGDPEKMAGLTGVNGSPDPGFKLPATFTSRYRNFMVIMPEGRKIKFKNGRYVARDFRAAAYLMYGVDAAKLEGVS